MGNDMSKNFWNLIVHDQYINEIMTDYVVLQSFLTYISQ